MSEEPTTGARKRQQIVSTNKQMMIYVAAAAAIVTVCIMLSINFWQRISYQMRVNEEWGITNDTLKESITNIPELRKNVEALSANSNIKSIQGLVDPELEKWQVVFDVLPSSCDAMAVEYSFTNIIFKPSQLGAGIKNTRAVMEGVSCEAMSPTAGEGETTTNSDSSTLKPQPVAMMVSFELDNATDDDIKKALLSMEYSLHPITVQSIEIDSDESGVRTAKISAITYFVPKATWKWDEKTIPFNEEAPASKTETEAKE